MRVWLFTISMILFVMPGLAAGTSYQCEFGITTQTISSMYNGQQRNNPDGTYYPGDAFNYIASYSGLESCFQPIVYEPTHTDDLVLTHHTYEDSYSVKSFENISNFYCKFNYCSTGHSEIVTFADDGLENMEFSAGGWKVICKIINDEEVCNKKWISKTAFLFVDVVDPMLKLHMEKKFMNDSDGYNATNMDGTYYMWDPIVISSIPTYNWKNERDKTLFIEYEKYPKLYREFNNTCTSPQCLLHVNISGFTPIQYNFTYGDDITIYNATKQHMFGNHTILHKIKLSSVSGDEITTDIDKNSAMVVVYKPIFNIYPYLVLADGNPMSWDNRHGIAIFYNGTMGSGPDDKFESHSNRRSKINNFSSDITVMRIDKDVPIDREVVWSDAYEANSNKLGYCTNTQFESGILESIGSETAMFIRSGYGSVIFDLSISDIMRKLPYSHATVIGNIKSNNFAGHDSIEIFDYRYTYPDVLFGNNISLIAVDSNGQILDNVQVSINVLPNLEMDGVSYTHDYVCDKSEFDTGIKNMGDILVNDMYQKKAQANTFGKTTLYLPRISTWNAPHLDDFLSIPINYGYDAPSPYIIHLSAGEKTITNTFSYSHVTDHKYVANQDQNNILHIKDNRAGIVIQGSDSFGHIRSIKIDNTDQIHYVNCHHCIIPTPKNSVLVEAYNIWGGRASATYELNDVEHTVNDMSNLYLLVVMTLGFTIAAYIVHRIIRGYI